MKTTRAFLRLNNGEQQEFQVKLNEKVDEGVHAIFIDGLSGQALDAEFGAGIELQVDGMKSWMSDFRHSEIWCCPAFGADLSEVPDETQGLIYEKTDSSFGVILPVVSEQYKCVLTGNGPDTVLAKLFSWYESLATCKALAVVWAEGDNP